MKSLAIQGAIRAAGPVLEKLFLSEVPVIPPSYRQFETTSTLLGASPFRVDALSLNNIEYLENGEMALAAGDYRFPVMTFCMNGSANSPSAYPYVLSKFEGTRAEAIQEINARLHGSPVSLENHQRLSWSLQSGMSYLEYDPREQRNAELLIPHRRAELEGSFFDRFERKWNTVARNSGGLIPYFHQVSDEFFLEFGEWGRIFLELRTFRDSLRTQVNESSGGIARIDRGPQVPPPEHQGETPWSKISDRVYARFITQGGFMELGQIEIRVLPNSRGLSSEVSTSRVRVSPGSWLANPRNAKIQPLSFAPLITAHGAALIPRIAMAHPGLRLGALLAILSSQAVDWDAYIELRDLLRKQIQSDELHKVLDQGDRVLAEAHDELEKPLRDAGVIDQRLSKKERRSSGKTRQYTKPGGKSALEKDFDRILGQLEKSTDGTEVKVLPNGSKLIKRSNSKRGQPVLEVQPSGDTSGKLKNTRIKVRYEK